MAIKGLGGAGHFGLACGVPEYRLWLKDPLALYGGQIRDAGTGLPPTR